MGEPYREKIAQRLYALLFNLTTFISAYDAAGKDKDLKYNHFRQPYPCVTLDRFHIIGAALTFISILSIAWVLRVNKFASTVIYKQKDQCVIHTGPYAWVRHPL